MLQVAVLLESPAGEELLQDALESEDDNVRETAKELAKYLASCEAVADSKQKGVLQ